jgi:peptide/nickel transport system substrate-binding protein
VSAEEATERYTNLAEWFRRRGHFWLGTGPYFLQRAFPVEGTVILEHNPAYAYPSDRWSAYSTPAFPTAVVDGPTEMAIGDEASYTVTVTNADGDAYAAEDISRVLYLVFDAEGNLVLQGDAEGGDGGQYTITFDTSDLPEGSNRLQVVVVSKLVGVPLFLNQQFVTTQ